MTLSLTERRAALREAAAGGDAADIASFARALDGANEEDRAALAKTLPPSRLFSAEGPTPRACFVLAALGKPKLVADTLAPADMVRKREYAGRHAEMAPAVVDAAAGRDAPWRAAFVELLAEQRWWAEDLAWPVCHALVRLDGDAPLSMPYLRCFVQQVSAIGGDGQLDADHGKCMAAYLQANPDQIEREFWALFRVEGMGADYLLMERTGPAWDAAVLTLCQDNPAFRDRLLAESLEALLRDFPAKTIAWYLRMHRLADPAAHEIAARQHTYFAVLGTAPSTAVGLALDMLKRAAGLLDVDAMIDAGSAVLTRSEKKLVKGQIGLFAALKTDAGQQVRVSRIVGDALDGMPLDLASLARKLVTSSRETQPAEASGQAHGQAHGQARTKVDGECASQAITMPAPRRKPLPDHPEQTPGICGDEELHALIAAQFEGTGHGADLPRIVDYLAVRPHQPLPEALQHRAAEIIESVWEERDASPRRLLAAALLGREDVSFRGYARYVVAIAGKPDPVGVALQEQTVSSSRYDAKTGDWKADETWTSRWGYQYLPTHSPLALLAGVYHDLRSSRAQGKPFRPPVAVPAQRVVWERMLAEPGDGTFSRDLAVLGDGAKPFWMATDAAASASPALDVADVPAEFTFRAQEAREQDGYDQVVQWSAWLLQSNPDTLAAHFHPMLCAAVQVINVRGLGPLLTALGASRLPPGEPVYSALALAASAKMAEQRAQAAEAIARLADAGLLDPAPFAAQIAAHLAQGFALAGRLAQTLADAASISAITGCRALQTLEALLPQLLDAQGKPLAQAGKLIELAARLSDDYGMPITLPATLAARRKGASVLAVTLRSLEAVAPRVTPLATTAAAAAQRSLEG
ncbi:DUF6493 family protein [Achromobacter animicus]|uniref:DUF6493 family protein n=1 Tax=Achromobacter animicus TaxID=1389935 RepID=UPI0028A9E400|nr:DUF6493 family protein [Achromobacter animicus]